MTGYTYQGTGDDVLAVRRQVRPPAKCGTDSGYYRHLRTTKTEPCDDCRQAHALAERLAYARRRLEAS